VILGYQVCGLRADAQEVVVRVRHRMSHLRTGVGVPNTNSPISDKTIDDNRQYGNSQGVVWSNPASPTVIRKAEWPKLFSLGPRHILFFCGRICIAGR